VTSAAASDAAAPPAPAVKWSLPARAVAFFAGPVGFGVKIAFLAIVNAIAVWAAVVLATDEKWIALLVCIAATLAIDAVYFSKRSFPLKFLIPGTVFLLAFQVAPIVYNANIAFTNWSTGHFGTKDEAIVNIQLQSLEQSETGGVYVMAPARDENGQLVLVLVDEETGAAYVGTREGLEEQPEGAVETSADGLVTGAPEGYTLVPPEQLLALDRQLAEFTVPVEEGRAAIRPEGLEAAVTLQPTLRYEPATDTFVRISDGTTFTDNGEGSFESASGEELEPGWKTRVGLTNFTSIVNDPLVRDPFIRVFVWTFFFAFSCVFLSFALGHLLANALDRSGQRFQRTNSSLLVLPYAIPGFLSILVWAGLLNDEFGVVNNVLHTSIPWLFDPTWAKVSVILVSVWLTFPYFFLVSMGALQSIPDELVEAARVDGGGPLQIFRRITLPLLLVAVAPLLIASFAFNFNNFNNVYLLTGGGPPAEDQSVAGATDILISYTYKIAFEAGKGGDYGLASAVSILIFFIVGAISAISFWRTKSLETMA
jgi:arabinogalactan oligomer/maltooligosaccharide transport system permease protein